MLSLLMLSGFLISRIGTRIAIMKNIYFMQNLSKLLISCALLTVSCSFAINGNASLTITDTTTPLRISYPKIITVDGDAQSLLRVDMDEHRAELGLGYLVTKANNSQVIYTTVGQAACVAVAFYDVSNGNSAFIHLSNPKAGSYDSDNIKTKLADIRENNGFSLKSTKILISPGTAIDKGLVAGVKQWAEHAGYLPPLQTAGVTGADSTIFYINGESLFLYGVSQWSGNRYYWNTVNLVSTVN